MGVSRETTSAERTVDHIITLMPPGTHRVTVEAAGFRKSVQKIQPWLESQPFSVGSVINQQFGSELPLNGRNFMQLAILTAGVNGTAYSVGGTIRSGASPDDRRPGTEIFSNVNRERFEQLRYDGVDNNERLIQLIVLRPAIEPIHEF